MAELKKLGGQLRSYKGWLTQSVNNCLELIKIPSSASNASAMMGRLETALEELDERRHKVEACLESMEALEFDKEDDENRKEKEKYYAELRLEIAHRCQSTISKVYLVYTRLNTQPEAASSASPAPVAAGGGGLGGHVKVLDSLKPFILSKNHIPGEFHAWKQQFKAFFSASNLNKLTVAGQQAFLKKQLDSTLLCVLDPLITSTTPVFDDENMPGTDSCFKLLDNEFMLRYPIVARRFQFFSQSQKKDQSFTEYLGNVKSSSALSDLGTLGIEGLIVYNTIIGLHPDYSELRKKILELPNLTMAEIERVSRAFESAQCAIKEIGGKAGASAVLRTENTDYNYDMVFEGKNPSERRRLLGKKGWCLRCGRHPKDKKAKCWAKRAQCFGCGDFGHLGYLCPNESDKDSSSGSSDGDY